MMVFMRVTPPAIMPAHVASQDSTGQAMGPSGGGEAALAWCRSRSSDLDGTDGILRDDTVDDAPHEIGARATVNMDIHKPANY